MRKSRLGNCRGAQDHRTTELMQASVQKCSLWKLTLNANRPQCCSFSLRKYSKRRTPQHAECIGRHGSFHEDKNRLSFSFTINIQSPHSAVTCLAGAFNSLKAYLILIHLNVSPLSSIGQSSLPPHFLRLEGETSS